MYVESKSNAHKLKIYNQVKACGYRLDFVIYNQSNRKSAVLEVDGKSHFNNNGKEYSEEHLDRIETLKRAGWKIVNTSYHHWYKNGWICDNNSPKFNKELNRIYLELDEILGLKSKIQ
jgi:very-short-patch-repair endonuclease